MQFGWVIGLYQVIKYKFVDVYIVIELVCFLVYGVVVLFELCDVSVVKVVVSEVVLLVVCWVLQIYGVIGFICEYDLLLWLLWVQVLYLVWGMLQEYWWCVLEVL